MEFKKQTEFDSLNARNVLFGFELSRTQTLMIMIFSLIGVFLIPFFLAGDISFNLISELIDTLPAYLSDPSRYDNSYLYYHFAPVITSISINSIFLCLSIFTLRKILKKENDKYENNRKIIQQDRIVNWFGLKLSHGQSFFIFILSLAGILFTFQFYIETTTFFYGRIEKLCYVPTGSYSAVTHELLLDNMPIIICISFILLCIYSIISSRRGKPISTSERTIKNYGLIVFICSFIILLFFLIRFFSHLFLFTFFGVLLGIEPYATDLYQTKDFILVTSILIICIILMISSSFLKEKNNQNIKVDNNLRWFGLRLTPNKAIILLSLSCLYITFFCLVFLKFFLVFSFSFYLSLPMFIPIIFLCYFTIEKIIKKQYLEFFIDSIEGSEEITIKWFKISLNRLYSILILSISSGVLFVYLFQLNNINMGIKLMINMINNSETNVIWILYNILMTGAMIALLVIDIFSIKRTLPSIKLN